MNETLKNFARKKLALQQKMNLNLEDEATERKFNFVSAELLHFLPDIPFSNYGDIFNKILFNIRLNKLEQEFPSVMEDVSITNFPIETANFIKKNPCIFCAWHFGAYKSINHFLAQKGIPYALVISKNILQSEGNNFIENFNKIYGDSHQTQLSIIDAESPQAGLKILRNIKEGKSILFYIDGNTGSGSTVDNENNCCIDFLNGKIFARKGIAYFSHLAKTPILPIITYRKGRNRIIFEFGDLMFPDIEKDRNEFATDCTQKLYDLIAPKIKMFPDQWEAWMYLYKVMKWNNSKLEQIDFNPEFLSQKLIFNSMLFGIYKFEESYFLFNKKHFISFAINRDIYNFLKESTIKEIMPGRMDEMLF